MDWKKVIFVLLVIVPLSILWFAFSINVDRTINAVSDPTQSESNQIEIDDPIKLSYFYKPPWDSEGQQQVIEHFDTLILTRNDEWFRDQLLEDADVNSLQYLRFEQIHDPCRLGATKSCECDESPFSNNVAWKRDECWKLYFSYIK